MPWFGGTEFFESSGADDHRRKPKNACTEQIVSAVIAIAQEPAPCVLSNLKERSARINGDRHCRILRHSKLYVGVFRLQRDRFLFAIVDHIANDWIRRSESDLA